MSRRVQATVAALAVVAVLVFAFVEQRHADDSAARVRVDRALLATDDQKLAEAAAFVGPQTKLANLVQQLIACGLQDQCIISIEKQITALPATLPPNLTPAYSAPEGPQRTPVTRGAAIPTATAPPPAPPATTPTTRRPPPATTTTAARVCLVGVCIP